LGTIVRGSILNALQDDPEHLRAPAIVPTLGRTEEPFMAYPNDPYRSDWSDDERRRAARFDDPLQPDPEPAEGTVGTGRIAVYALGVAILLGVVFYSLNTSSVNQAGTTPPAQTAQTPPAAPPGMRDVTPHANPGPGVTTGSATNRPMPMQLQPDADRAAAPAAGPNGAPPAKQNDDPR
jgi:hypothetical protein